MLSGDGTLDEAGKANPERDKVPGSERLPCCACLKLRDEVKELVREVYEPRAQGIITKSDYYCTRPSSTNLSSSKQRTTTWCRVRAGAKQFCAWEAGSFQFMCEEKARRCCVGAVTGVRGGLWYSEASGGVLTAVAILGVAVLCWVWLSRCSFKENLRQEVGGGLYSKEIIW